MQAALDKMIEAKNVLKKTLEEKDGFEHCFVVEKSKDYPLYVMYCKKGFPNEFRFEYEIAPVLNKSYITNAVERIRNLKKIVSDYVEHNDWLESIRIDRFNDVKIYPYKGISCRDIFEKLGELIGKLEENHITGHGNHIEIVC